MLSILSWKRYLIFDVRNVGLIYYYYLNIITLFKISSIFLNQRWCGASRIFFSQMDPTRHRTGRGKTRSIDWWEQSRTNRLRRFPTAVSQQLKSGGRRDRGCRSVELLPAICSFRFEETKFNQRCYAECIKHDTQGGPILSSLFMNE